MTGLTVSETSVLESTIQRAVAGDEAAFARLVTEHHGSIARVAFVVCGDREVASDAVQSAWMIAWRRLRSLRDPSQLRAWLVAIAANEARGALRRQRQRWAIDISTVTNEAAPGTDPADAISEVDLERAVRRLRPEDRSLLALRYVAGLDSSDIARNLGLSASGVRTRLSRILERLRMEIDHV